MKKALAIIATIITLFVALCLQAQAKSEFKLDENGVLWGKGDNNHCQLGFDSNGENVEDFVKITDNVKEFTGNSTIYAIKNDNSVWAWGYNGEGNCGTGNTETVKTPTKILDNAVQSSFSSGCIVLDAEGKLWVWGSNASSSLWGPNYGNIGLGDEVEFISTPTILLEDVREISLGFVSSSKAVFAIKNNGELFGFGRDASDFGLSTAIKKVEEINNAKKVTVSNYMAIAETNDNEVYVCGSYPIGTWSATTQTQTISSNFKKIFDDVKMIAEGYDSTAICVIKNDNNLYGWGYKPNFGMRSENKNSYTDKYTKDAVMLLENVKDAVYVKVPNMWTRLFVLTNEGDLYISRRVGVAYYGSVGLPINDIEKNCLTLAMTNVEEILPDGTVMHKNGSVWSVGNSVLEKIHAEEVKENECISPPTKDFATAITGDGYKYENGTLYLTGIGEASVPTIDVEPTEIKKLVVGKSITNLDNVISALNKNEKSWWVEEIIVDEENEHFSSLNGVLFNKDKSVLIKFPPFKEGEYTIPEGVKELDARTFARSINVTKVIIPDGVTEIKSGTFSQCMKLESITIPKSVKIIEAGAFSGGDTNMIGQHPTALKEIDYKGAYAQWSQIQKGASYNYHRMNITQGGDILKKATKHFTDTYILFGGKRIDLTAPMYASYDRVMVPLEDICTAMGYSVQWDNAAWGVRAIKDSTHILFPIFPDNTSKGEVYDVYYIDGSGESVVTQNSYQLQSLQGGLYYEDIYHHTVLDNGKAMASVKLLEKVFGSEAIFGTDDMKSKAEFISRFDDHTIVFYENTIWAWGGEYGEVPVKLLENVKKLEVLNASSGEYSYYAICEDNSLYVWGAHGFYANMMPGSKPSTYTYVGGMLGMACNTNVAPLYYGPPGSIDYSKYSEKTPDQTTPVKLLDNIEKVIAGDGKVVALGVNGEVYIWGQCSDANNIAPKLINSNAQKVYVTGTSPAFNTGLIGILEKYDSLAIYSGDSLKVRVNDVVKTYVVMQQYFPSFFVLAKDGRLWKADSSDKNVVMENVTGFEQIKGIIYVRTADGSVYESGLLTGNLQLTDKEIEFEEIFERKITVNVNGETLITDVNPYIKNDRTLVPMRAIFEALGAEVSWDNDTRTAIGKKGNVEVKITIGENVLYKNGEAIELDAPAEITNDRTMVPVRAISEAFGCTVNWDNDTKTVEITN
ncbi:MAG: leucine-rich repeat protein [Clostridia bacterium]|nr:leucine-rich repeat protein [Clostridia bacterium]